MIFWIITIEAALASVIYNMWLFDRLVRWEYDHQREQWQRDGSPDGYFWRPPGCTFWSSDMAKKRLGLLWLFSTPQWMAESPKCRRWLLQTRVISLLASLGAGLLLACLAIRFYAQWVG